MDLQRAGSQKSRPQGTGTNKDEDSHEDIGIPGDAGRGGRAGGRASAQATLEAVKARGELICGSNTGLTGFGAPDASGNWTGFDVDLCRAVAAAIFGDATKVKFVPTTGETRFTALQSGEVDLLVRNSTWTFSRDSELALDFVAVNYYAARASW